jgi:sialic acid synthase SpsE
MQTKIIAEIASSHSGDLNLAKALILAAKESNADLVKFQDWRASNVPAEDLDKFRYEKYEFPDEWYSVLIPYCQELGIEFLTTCFNTDRAKFLADLGLKKIKIASISLTNTELLMAAGLNFEEVIVSTAMHTNEEIEEAIDLLASNAHKFTIMHCVGNYPTLPGDANLNRIDELKEMIRGQEYASVGFSDHCLALEPAKIAMSKGISYLEKHFSLSRYLPQIPHQMYKGGPRLTTHSISIEPHEFKELATWRDWVWATHGSKSPYSEQVEQLIKERYNNRYGK